MTDGAFIEWQRLKGLEADAFVAALLNTALPEPAKWTPAQVRIAGSGDNSLYRQLRENWPPTILVAGRLAGGQGC